MNPKQQTQMVTEFDGYRITNGAVKWKSENGEYSDATKLGCTGALSAETEIKPVIKKCEGQEVKNVPIPQKVTLTFTGHMPVDVLRKAYGLTDNDLEKGVFSYGLRSRGGNGIFTWEVHNLEETEVKYLAFTNGNMSGSLNFNIENGADEIAEIEMTIECLKDELNNFYYEAYGSELDDDVEESWMSDFNTELVIKKQDTEEPPKKPEVGE